MRKKSLLLTILIITVISAISIALPVIAYTNSNLTQLLFADSDMIYNYDFSAAQYDYTHVDHPVTIIFRGQISSSNVNKTRIFNEFSSNGFQYLGSSIDNNLNDGLQSAFYWIPNTDKGRKTAKTDLDAWHYRLYAANDVNMLNSMWNKYVIATTHRDWLLYTGYGYQEDCENLICTYASAKPGWVVNQDTLYLYNRDWPGYQDGLQFWKNDGYASIIIIP